MNTSDLNKVLKEVLGIEPLIEYVEPKTERTAAMNYGLAQMWTIEGFRDYLIQSLRVATYNAAMSADNELAGAALRARMLTLKELLKKSEEAYTQFEKVAQLQKKNGQSANK